MLSNTLTTMPIFIELATTAATQSNHADKASCDAL